MSLVFGAANSDRVDHGTLDGVSWDQFTWMGWFNITSFFGSTALVTRNSSGGGMTITLSTAAGTNFAFFWGSGGSNCSYVTAENFATGKWWFFALTADRTLTGGGSGQRVHMYYADLATSVVENTYSSSADGDSLHNLGGETYLVGNNNGNTAAFNGLFSVQTMLGNRVLTLGEIQRWKNRSAKYWSEQVLHTRLGSNGTTNVPDHSGNGYTGTITGATVGNDVPLGPWYGFDDYSFNPSTAQAQGASHLDVLLGEVMVGGHIF